MDSYQAEWGWTEALWKIDLFLAEARHADLVKEAKQANPYDASFSQSERLNQLDQLNEAQPGRQWGGPKSAAQLEILAAVKGETLSLEDGLRRLVELDHIFAGLLQSE